MQDVEGPADAAREAAALVAMLKSSPQCRRDRPRPGADLEQATILVVPHDDAAGVARQAPGRFRGNVYAVLEHRLTGLIWIGQSRGVDVDHDLMAFARRAGIHPVMQDRFRDEGQCVGALLDRTDSVVEAKRRRAGGATGRETRASRTA